jgi:effector-binding domain-containing protein
MRILKYFFLLILLALFATTIFIATQKGNFDVEKSAVIKSPKSTVFNYINDYRNWETFSSWKKEDPQMEFIYPKATVGKGGSYSWKGKEGDGNIKTISVIDNNSIIQKMNYNGSVSDVFWIFKDTLGGTKVTWRAKGIMNFSFKIYTAFNGGVNNVIGDMYEKSLANLDKTLDYELNTYSIKVNGLVQKNGCFYLKQTIVSTIDNVPKNLRIMIPKIIYFFKKNNLTMHGKPFVIYHTYDVPKGITKFSVCIPIKEAVFTSEGSDITSGKLNSFQSIKTTLTGDYSHKKAAWNKALNYIKKNKLTENTAESYVEVYSKNMEQIANPSQWITEIYIPVKPKSVAVPKPVAAVNVPITATEESTQNPEP